MLQVNEIQQRFTSIEQAIGQASQACSAERDVPKELRDCIQKMDSQSDQAKSVLQSQDQMQIQKMVDDLEELGDRAKKVCTSGGTISPQMKTAVMRVHDELSSLKHQIH